MIYYIVVAVDSRSDRIGSRYLAIGSYDLPNSAISRAKGFLPTRYDKIVVQRMPDKAIIWDSVDHNW